jgi:hypothetical protein
MAGRSYRFGSLEIIIIFGESLERGALKSPFPKPDTVSCNIRKQQYNNIINKNGQAEHRIKK